MKPQRPRCNYKTRSGKPCRYSAAPNSLYCTDHSRAPQPDQLQLAAELAEAAGNLDSPADVTKVLRCMFLALASGHITERRAGILCYIFQTILQANRAVPAHQRFLDEQAAAKAAEEEAAEEAAEVATHTGPFDDPELPLLWHLQWNEEDLEHMALSRPKALAALFRARAIERQQRASDPTRGPADLSDLGRGDVREALKLDECVTPPK